MGLQSVSVAVARDVMSVAGERAPATTTDGLTASLAELVELTTDCRALVSHDGNGTLTVRTSGGTSRLAVERT